MSDIVLDWIAEHSASVPPSLARAMAVAASAGPDDTRSLAGAATNALRAALRHGSDREAAFQLLAADALLTAACERAAARPGELSELAINFAPAGIAALLAHELAQHRP